MCAYWVGCALRGGVRPVGWLGCIVGLLGCMRAARAGQGGQAGPAGLHEHCPGGPLRGLRGNRERESGMEGLAGPGSVTSRVSTHCRIGVRKSFFFFQSFHNLQTYLNSNSNFSDFYSQNKIQEHFTTQRKLCISMKCIN
jgi:hypothetical protein